MKKFLVLLSAYFLNENSLKGIYFIILKSKNYLILKQKKVLEYLLRNYEIHIYESDYLVTFFLPYHSTLQYIKLIQNVNLEISDHFKFLE